jgi:hypothetical protein
MMRRSGMAVLLAALCLSTACSTRQPSDTVSGSTAQRLVTYSLEKFVRNLTRQPEMQKLQGQTVALKLHFLKDHTLLDYATELVRHRLQRKYQVTLVPARAPARFEVAVFFNSIGTDYDSFGLTVPSFGLASGPDARISLLSIDMFHGITEGYALLKDTQTDSSSRTQKLLARVRADNVTTPILEFPVNQLD